MKKEINIVLKTDIDALKEGFSEAIKATKAAGKTISKEMGEAIAGIEKGFSNIATSKNSARAVKQLQNMAMTMRELGPEFQSVADDMIRRAGGIKDAFGDVGAEIAYFASDTRRFDAVISGLQGVAGAFATVEGSMAVMGVENQDLQKTLVKLAGAMAVIQGLQEIQNVLQQESAFMIGIQTGAQKAYNAVVGQSVGAMKNFKIALATTGVGALVVGLGLLIANFEKVKASITGVTETQRKMNASIADAENQIEPQIQSMKAYSAIVNDATKSEGERKTALSELNKMGVETRDINLKNADALKTLNERTSQNIALTRAKAISEALNKIVAEENLKVVRLQIQQQKDFNTLVEAQTNKLAPLNKEFQGLSRERAREVAISMVSKKQAEELNEARGGLLQVESAYNKAIAEQNKLQAKAIAVKDKVDASTQNQTASTKKLVDATKELRDLEAQIQADGAKAKPTQRTIGEFAPIGTREDFTKPQRDATIQGEAELTDEQAAQQSARIDNMRKELEAKKGVYQTEADQLKQRVQAQEEYQARMAIAAESINQSFENSMENTAVAFGQLIGDLANGTGGLETFTNNILNTLADFLSSMGKALIAAAIATKAFKDLLLTNPVAAIGAGIAAVAASVVVRNYAQEGPKFANGGIVSGPTYGLMGEYPNANRNPEVIAPLDKLKSLLGDTSGGSGYVAETTIKGKDLALVLRRYNEGVSRG